MASVRRLGVSGSRTWEDALVLRQVLDQICVEAMHGGANTLIVMHGAHKPRPDPVTGRVPARSADWLTHLWVELLPHPISVLEEPYPADWSGPCDPGGCPPCPRKESHRKTHQSGKGSYCPLAGHRRNQEMVDRGMDHGLFFWRDRSRGTQDCLERAKLVLRPDQITVVEQRTVRPRPGAAAGRP